MTWFSYHNYGTALQAVALYHSIRKIGHVPLVINYLPKEKKKKIHLSRVFSYFSKTVNLLLSGGSYKDDIRKMKFNDFINTQLAFTDKCDTENELKELCVAFDAFICGSDQIWSPANFDAHYFLDFVRGKKKIAFAPSIGLSTIDDKAIRDHMAKLISDFDSISVREKRGVEIIKNICGIEATLALDPTLLLCAAEWSDLLELDRCSADTLEEKYILGYFLGNRPENWALVKSFYLNKNMQLAIIPRFRRDGFRDYEVLHSEGPIEFINHIRNAECILTDSFHGVLFAIIFEKDFYVFERFTTKDDKNQNSRIYNILEILSIEDRLIRNTKDFRKATPLNYDVIKKIVSKRRMESIEYLKTALKE